MVAFPAAVGPASTSGRGNKSSLVDFSCRAALSASSCNEKIVYALDSCLSVLAMSAALRCDFL